MNMVISYFFESDGFLFVLRSNNDFTNTSKQLLLNIIKCFSNSLEHRHFLNSILRTDLPVNGLFIQSKDHYSSRNERYSNSVYIVCIAMSLFLHHCYVTSRTI